MPKEKKSIVPMQNTFDEDRFLSWEDVETKEMIRAAEKGKWIKITDPKILDMYTKTAHNTPISRKSVTIKLLLPTYNRLRAIAANEGMPYQTLMNSVLKKYTEGKMVEKN